MKNSKKFLLSVLSTLVLSASAFAEGETKTVAMNADEIRNAIALFDRLEVAAISQNADCTETEATIESRSKGFNRANWTAEFNDGYISTAELPLEQEEISAAIDLFDRVGVPLIKIDSITRMTRATIKSRVCNMRAAKWTVSFVDESN